MAGDFDVTARNWLGVAAFVACSFLAFPQVVAGHVFDLGWIFAWLAPASLAVALGGLAPRRAAWAGFVAGWLAHAAILHWIYVVTAIYGRAPAAVGILAPTGLALYMAAFTTGQGAAWAWLVRRGRGGPFVFAALWAALDHGRHFVLSGFPWGVIGYAQHESPALLGLAPYTGVVGLSFVTALGGAGLALLVPGIVRGSPTRRARAMGALVVTALAMAGGTLSNALADRPAGGSLRLGLLQGNIDQGIKWSPAFAEETMRVYEDLSRRAVAEGARLVVWPETAVPGSVETEPGFGPRLSQLARELGVVLVVGAVGVEPWQDDYRFFDSAYVYDGTGVRLDRYDKAHLVPFGEYLPLREVLGRYIRAVATGIARDDVTEGQGPRACSLPFDPDAGGPAAPAEAVRRGEAERTVRAGIPICYELLFPDLVRRFAGDGAEILVAITNDAWYGRSGAPYQFLAITALRSAETRLWTARAANTGITALIDDLGRVREQTAIFERTLLVGDVPLRSPGHEATFYVRHGDVFAGACWASLAVFAILGVCWPRGERDFE
ncbi:MAG: apolipoprotein N-acyltransferase [Deltaproteobacteria bacterium]|nr:apolipoprotein N-acyltransferase [Deltaproteobacteria bacterium]